MTQPNQSELEEALSAGIDSYISGNGGGERAIQILMDYITANYTHNAEVAEREHIAALNALEDVHKRLSGSRLDADSYAIVSKALIEAKDECREKLGMPRVGDE